MQKGLGREEESNQDIEGGRDRLGGGSHCLEDTDQVLDGGEEGELPLKTSYSSKTSSVLLLLLWEASREIFLHQASAGGLAGWFLPACGGPGEVGIAAVAFQRCWPASRSFQ